MLKVWKTAALTIAAVLCFAQLAIAAPVGEWNLVNPSGEIERYAIPPADRINSLDGMTIGLRRNGKHNSDAVLDHLAELLARDFPTATIIKFYDSDAVTDSALQNDTILTGTNYAPQSASIEQSQMLAETIKASGVDIVIAAQGD